MLFSSIPPQGSASSVSDQPLPEGERNRLPAPEFVPVRVYARLRSGLRSLAQNSYCLLLREPTKKYQIQPKDAEPLAFDVLLLDHFYCSGFSGGAIGDEVGSTA